MIQYFDNGYLWGFLKGMMEPTQMQPCNCSGLTSIITIQRSDIIVNSYYAVLL